MYPLSFWLSSATGHGASGVDGTLPTAGIGWASLTRPRLVLTWET